MGVVSYARASPKLCHIMSHLDLKNELSCKDGFLHVVRHS